MTCTPHGHRCTCMMVRGLATSSSVSGLMLCSEYTQLAAWYCGVWRYVYLAPLGTSYLRDIATSNRINCTPSGSRYSFMGSRGQWILKHQVFSTVHSVLHVQVFTGRSVPSFTSRMLAILEVCCPDAKTWPMGLSRSRRQDHMSWSPTCLYLPHQAVCSFVAEGRGSTYRTVPFTASEGVFRVWRGTHCSF